MIEKISNFINGNFEAPKSNKYLDVFEPATGYSYAEVPNSNRQDIDLAVKAAKNAFPLWSEFSIGERSIYLKKIADEIQLNLEAFAAYESRDTGKPISLAKKLDIPRSISNFTFFIDFIDKQKKELVWQGVGTGALKIQNLEKKEARVKEFVKEIVSKFPPQKNK